MPKRLGRARWAGVSLVLGLAAVPSVAAQPATATQILVPSDSVAIAGLLGGNVLVPLAQYSHGGWTRTWPRPGEQVEAPIHDREDLPHSWYPTIGGVPREWRLWTEGANADTPLSTGRPVLAEAHCEAVWGLSTNRQPDGHETTAIAVHGPTLVRPFVRSKVDAVSDAPLFAFLERRAARLESDTIGPPLPGGERTYDVRCARLDESSELCSLEGVRTLHMEIESDRDAEPVVVMQGWLLRGPDGPAYLQSTATLTDTDFKELRSVSPLALAATDARTFVVVKEHGYEDESFKVLEIEGGHLKELLEIEGGGC